MAERQEAIIDLPAFAAALRRSVYAFEANWIAKQKADPARWPDRMSESDWHEQFVFWISSEDCEIAKS